MIPDSVNIDDLNAQVAHDRVAMDFDAPVLHEDLLRAIEYAGEQEFGDVAFVALAETPAVTADLRDIAQEILQASDAHTVIVRAPGSGAIVSDTYTRAQIESAQWNFLGTPDYAEATTALVEHIQADPIPGEELVAATVVGIIATIAAIVWWFKRGLVKVSA